MIFSREKIFFVDIESEAKTAELIQCFSGSLLFEKQLSIHCNIVVQTFPISFSGIRTSVL